MCIRDSPFSLCARLCLYGSPASFVPRAPAVDEYAASRAQLLFIGDPYSEPSTDRIDRLLDAARPAGGGGAVEVVLQPVEDPEDDGLPIPARTHGDEQRQ